MRHVLSQSLKDLLHSHIAASDTLIGDIGSNEGDRWPKTIVGDIHQAHSSINFISDSWVVGYSDLCCCYDIGEGSRFSISLSGLLSGVHVDDWDGTPIAPSISSSLCR